ncbi:RNA polymerase sigma factor [Pedobacter nyackensis]|uniref:RNA polymerase sigma-70 factor, ECF subfamily n=1 Tax=Pedobacter nyackensis TaxID=475255 RepID=A0A1W2CWS6_9SPHI|nr:sigma-70 family RNA polymerase sigma factor [Pedobacter nyackensis]SMC89695.1 RNA polymerase sigma-70 factor, ECF subfamily [Pedobacter nyackensis]
MKTEFCDLESLWSRLRNGEEEALFGLFKDLYNPLFNYGFSLYGTKENVEDAISQVFLELWEKRLTLKSVANVKSYLFTYLRRKISWEHEKEIKCILPDREMYEVSVMDYMVQLQTEEEIRRRVLNAINKLPPRQKQLIMFKFYQNLGYDEISEITGLATQSIYNNIHQSLKSLHEELKMPIGLLLLVLKM